MTINLRTHLSTDTERTMNHTTSRTFPIAGRHARALGALLLAATLGACDSLDRALEVETPSRVPASDLQTPSSANLLVNSAQRDLECAYGAFVVVSGLVAGELQDGSQTASRWDFDRRSIRPEQTSYASTSCEGAYVPLPTIELVRSAVPIHARTIVAPASL